MYDAVAMSNVASALCENFSIGGSGLFASLASPQIHRLHL